MQKSLRYSFNKSQEMNEGNSNGKNLSIACDKKWHSLRSKNFHLNFCQVRKIGLGATTKVKGALPVLLMTFHSGLCKRKWGTRIVNETHG